MRTLDCVEIVLKKAGRAMSAVEMLPLIRELGKWTCESANPANSIRTQISSDIDRKGEKSRFCRPSRGQFALRTAVVESAPAPVAKPAQGKAEDIGYFYILSNTSFTDKWVKILTSYKPIALDGKEIDDPAVPLPYKVFSAYKTRQFALVRTAFFGALIEEEKESEEEPHEGFFHVRPGRAHQLMMSVAQSFNETDGVYVAHAKSREFELRNPRQAPADGSTEIYIGNLSYKTTEESLKATFAKFGAVVGIRIITNRFNGRSKGFGFVRMLERSDAEKACAALNGQEIEGRKLKVNIAKNVVELKSS